MAYHVLVVNPRQISSPTSLFHAIVAHMNALSTFKAWDESKHPRHPTGDDDGGKFAPKNTYLSFANDEEASAYARKNLNHPVSAKFKKVLRGYKVSDYKWINSELRNNGPFDQTSRKYHKALDEFINQSELPDDVEVYRGLRSQTITENFDDLVGAEIQDLAYVSTSMSKLTAGRFLADSENEPLLARIHLSKGQRAAYMENALDMGEHELLLPRGTRFRVVDTSIEDVDVYDEMRRTKCVTLEVINGD